MRSSYLHFIIVVTLLCAQGFKGFCQERNAYDKVIAIDTIKQDGGKKLILLYRIKANMEYNNQRKDTGYVLTLVKIAKYENEVNNDIPKAIAYTTQALQTLESAQLHTPNILANIYYNLAILFYNIRVYDQAKLFFDKTIEISDSQHLKDFYFEARIYEAVIDDLLGDYEKVEKESRFVMAEADSEQDNANYNLLLYLHCRALMFQNQLQLALSEAEQLEARAKQSNNNYFLANAYNLQAKICSKYKNYKAAERFYKSALITRLSDSDNEATAMDCNDMASFYRSNLQDYKQAEVYFNKSIFYGEKCPAEKRPKLFLMIYGNLGDLYVKANEFDKAITCYNKALNIVNIKTPNFLFSNPSIKQLSAIGEKDLILTILTSKCELLLSLFKKTKNNSHLQQCISTAITTDSLIVQMRHEQTGDKSKLYWRNETHNFFSKAMDACYLSGNIEKAFFFMEKSRSVLLNDKLNELNSAVSYLPQQRVPKENGMINNINQLQTKLLLIPASTPEYTTTLKILQKKQDELNTYIKSLEKKYPRYYQYKYADDVPALADVSKYLNRNNQSLIYYFAGDSAMYILGITKSGTRFIKVPSQSFDSRQLSKFTTLCSSRQQSNSSYTVFSSLSQNIYKELFEPLHIPGGSIIICTDNFFIPFDALCSDGKGKNFLLYSYKFSYTYSASTLLRPFESHTKPEGDFIGFAPVSFSQKLNVFPLNHSASALQKVANFYQKNVLLTDQNATRKNFFKQAPRYTVVTIFSHAQADTTDKEPVLYMQDSVIHLSELQMLNNPATQFVLLSACQTNAGRSAAGEGIYSLARGFASIGVPAVSATLWKADEEAVYSISAKFNEYLAKGMNKSEALQEAKIWYLKNSDREHALPYYWANMVLIGSSDPILLSQSNYNWLWLTASLFVILLIAVYFIYMYKMKYKKSEV